jgi:hypothetical protein
MLGDSIKSLMERLDVVEAKLNQNAPSSEPIKEAQVHSPKDGVWRGEDFMI